MALPATASFPQSGSIVSRWKLGEASGSRADSVGSNTLTDNNTVLSGSGQFSATAADFEDTNSEYLSITDGSQSGLDITGNLSMFTWVNVESDPVGFTYSFMAKHKTTTNDRGYAFGYEDPKELFLNISSNGSGVTSKIQSQTLTTGTWFHVGCVYTAAAGSVSFYVNGSQVGVTQTGLPTSIFNNASDFCLGAYGNPAIYYDGMMQDAIIWNVALTGSEVTSLYNAYFASTVKALAATGVG